MFDLLRTSAASLVDLLLAWAGKGLLVSWSLLFVIAARLRRWFRVVEKPNGTAHGCATRP